MCIVASGPFLYSLYMEHSIKRLALHLEPWPFLHDTQVTQLDHLPLLGFAFAFDMRQPGKSYRKSRAAESTTVAIDE